MRLLLTQLFVRAANRADAVIVVSESHRRRLIGSGVDPAKVQTVYVGRDPGRFRDLGNREEILRGLELDPAIPVLGCFSRLQPAKGVDVAILALAELRSRSCDAQLIVVGTGPQDEMLRNLVQRTGLTDRVRFLGYRDDVPALMSLCAAVLVPSVDEGESLPAVVVEAMMAGSCVVSTPVGGVPEIVRDGETGILARDATAATFADCLEPLLANEKYRKATAEAGRSYAIGQLGLDRMMDEIEGIISRLAQHGRGSQD
jgi:glycosyltransferase involved in cell wall biosynthesis